MSNDSYPPGTNDGDVERAFGDGAAPVNLIDDDKRRRPAWSSPSDKEWIEENRRLAAEREAERRKHERAGSTGERETDG